MRILYVNDRGNYYGGVEQSIADSSDGLRAAGHETVLAYGWDTGLGPNDRYFGHFDGHAECVGLGSNGSADVLDALVGEINPDVLYLNRIQSFAPFERYLGRIRVVRAIHDHDICCPTTLKYFRVSGKRCCHKAGWRCWLDTGFLERRAGSRFGFRYASIGAKLREMRRTYLADATVVDSHFMREELIQNGFPGDRVHVVHPVIQPLDVVATPIPKSPTLLHVGHLIRSKGVDLLLDALAQVRCPFRATLIGAGSAEAALRKRCERLGLGDRVKFVGWVERDKLDGYYRAARVLAVPSRWPEPFGTVGQYAMRHGRPTVAFAVGGISDWLEHEKTGLLVPEQDTGALSRAIARLLADDAKAAELGGNAARGIHEQFSYSRYISRLEAVFAGNTASLA